MRPSDGAYALAFADAEDITQESPPFNIALQVYDSAGNLLAQRAGPASSDYVNDPGREIPASQQLFPSVAFDDQNNLVVAWVGPALPDPANPPAECFGGFRIFARRFKFDPVAQVIRDPDPAADEGRLGMFIVDSDPFFEKGPEFSNPVVALKLYPGQLDLGQDFGSFVVAWNAYSQGLLEIRAQYFTPEGLPHGREVRLNQADGTGEGAALAPSGKHTLAYGPDHQIVVAWGEGDGIVYDQAVHFTLLPPSYRIFAALPDCTFCQQEPSACLPCLRGDVNGDCRVNGLDIQPFVDVLVGDHTCLSVVDLCPPDMQLDGDVDVDDIPCFVRKLIAGFSPCESGEYVSFVDCNQNGVNDPTDLFLRTSADCNANHVPDECDIADQTSADENENGVPDECEPDCNENGHPDDLDIASETSLDCNGNGVPDECEKDCNENGVPDDCDIDPADPDGDEWVSPDCNQNGTPDECEEDCNENGVPDDCDIDPSDPDGNHEVSEDCNENGWPDECDMALPPPLTSFDCNDNEVPDECDIASGYSQDANGNGIPDECEANTATGGGAGAQPPSPWQGEGAGMGGTGVWPVATPSDSVGGRAGAGDSGAGSGGGALEQEIDPDGTGDGTYTNTGGTGGSPGAGNGSAGGGGAPPDEEAAWEAFYTWAAEQCWGPDCELPGSEQWQNYLAMLALLGLPPP